MAAAETVIVPVWKTSNLVATVDEVASFEQETQTGVAEARAGLSRAQQQMSEALNDGDAGDLSAADAEVQRNLDLFINVAVEAYPTLRANENFRALQDELRHNPLADGSTPEALVDDGDAERVRITGEWERQKPTGTYGLSVLRREGPGDASVRFTPELRTHGRYTVYLYWPAVDAQ